MYSFGAAPTPMDLQERFGLVGQTSLYSAYMYDIVNIIVAAYEKAFDGKRVPTSDEVSAAIHSRRYWEGSVGKVTLSSDGQFHSDIQRSIVRNGKLEQIK
jgi:hypothetical protein